MKNWFNQLFCRHNWEPVIILDKNVRSKFGLRYARCCCECEKCGKREQKDILLAGKYQNLI